MQVSDDLKGKVEKLFHSRPPTLATTIGIQFIEMQRGKVVGRMPVDERTKQPFGILHGGASVALAETLASIGAWLLIDETKFDALGLEINANHLRAVSKGFVIGTATPIHVGQSTQIWEIKIEDEQGKLSCISRCTMAIRERRS